MSRARVAVFDTTLRDGEQSPGCSMNLEEKLRMARQLEALGVDVIEAGFPVASEDDFAAVRAVAGACRRATVAALCRTLPEDVRRAFEAIEVAARPRIHTFIATSDLHLTHKLKKSRAEALDMAGSAVALARQYADDVEFSAEDATRSDVDYLVSVLETAVAAGATVLNVPDTVGYTTPEELSALVRELLARVRGIERATLSVHCHDDLGLAVANSLAAVAAGARQVECTVNGIGERAGNAALEEIVMALRTRADVFPYETGIVTEEITRSSQLLSNITGVAVPPNKAVVGRNAFAHEAGIHQHGVLQNRRTYEIMTPESVGAKTQRLVLGKHSGRHALAERYREMGHPLAPADLEKAYKLFAKLSDQKKEVFEEDLLAIVLDGFVEIPEAFKLRNVQATAGTASVATALVTLAVGDEGETTELAAGDGPVEAVCNAIDKITGLSASWLDYSVRAVTGGPDAVGEVFVHVELDGTPFTGKAASTDVVDASARAYLNAVNKWAHARRHRSKAEAQAVA